VENLMADLPPARIPVIIGVGQINDRPADPEEGLDSFGLMMAALRAAESDAGHPLLGALDWLGVEDQISFPDRDMHERLAAALPHPPRHREITLLPGGEGPIELINDAAIAIARGEASIAAAVGGEAMRTAGQRAKAAAARGEPPQPDILGAAAELLATPIMRQYRLVNPIDVYPLYENATRAAWGQSLAEAQAESAAIWSGMSQVAAANPNAWLRKAMTPEQVTAVDDDNRMVSFPYSKLMVANNAVNQGAAVILSSLAVARELGIAENRLVYVGRGAAAHEPDDYLRREGYTRSTSIMATLSNVLAFNEITAGDLDLVELYSCFPCVPKMARRVLDWPIDKPVTAYGGLTFGGGPIGNCMMHATAAMTEKLRAGGAQGKGLVFANGGFATHNHAIVLSREAPRGIDLAADYDVQADAEAARAPAPELLESYAGPGTIESYVMPYGRDGRPRFASIVARTPEGARFVAHVPGEDSATLSALADGSREPVGTAGGASAMEDGRNLWTPAS
jgi:acetyl-CoA C-acetyltransferase